MATDRGFEARNRESLARLEALAARLGEAELARPLPNGWTVAATLVHLAFWDRRAAVIMDRLRQGRGGEESPVDDDVTNDTVAALARAVAPAAAARLAVEAARAADAGIEALPDATVERLAARGPFSLARHLHRAEHLDEMERALAR
jgi:hypothetical protein